MLRTPPIELPLHERTVSKLLAKHAATDGNHPFLLFEDQRYTYTEAEKLTNSIAHGMLNVGVSKGSHVALMMANRPEMLWTYLALAKIGAVVIPMNLAAKGELLASSLKQSESTIFVADIGSVERFAEIVAGVPAINKVIATDIVNEDIQAFTQRLGIAVIPWLSIVDSRCDPPMIEVTFRDTYLIMYTSGTTGPSKGSLSTQAYPITYGLQRVTCFGYNKNDVLYTCLPLFHGNGLISTCFAALVVGATIALSQRFSATRFWSEVRSMGATQFNLLGAMTNFLWAQPQSPLDTQHQVRQCTMVPLPDFAKPFEIRFGLKLTSVYALSDYGLGTLLGPDHPAQKWQSAGLPAPDMEVAIVDDDDLPVKESKVGEIVMRSRKPWTVGQGYWKNPEATVQAWRNLWFHTGDTGFLDSDGYLYFVDRKKDSMRRRGENISSWEVERIIQQHNDIMDVAAYPIRAELPEDEVMVSIVLHPGASMTPEALVDYCSGNMAYFMVPRFVEFRPSLPRTLTEKVEKYKLRQAAEAQIDLVWDREKAGIKLTR